MADLRAQTVGGNPCRELMPGWIHDIRMQRDLAQPQPMHARLPLIEDVRVEVGTLPGCRPICNDTSQPRQALDTLLHVLSAEHFEYRIHAFPAGKGPHVLDII